MTAISAKDARVRSALGHNLTFGLVDALGLAIVAGEFPSGVLPTEPELESRFSVSRSVVREAVKMLASKGMVVTRPRQGTIIEPHSAWNLFDPLVLRWMVEGETSPEMLRQLCEFSMSIEPAAAAVAALRGSAEGHAELAAACGRLSVADRHPPARSGEVIALHEAIVAASGNAFYLPLSRAVGAAHLVLARHGAGAIPAGIVPRYQAVIGAIGMRAPERSRREMAALLEVVFEPITGRPAAA